MNEASRRRCIKVHVMFGESFGVNVYSATVAERSYVLWYPENGIPEVLCTTCWFVGDACAYCLWERGWEGCFGGGGARWLL